MAPSRRDLRARRAKRIVCGADIRVSAANPRAPAERRAMRGDPRSHGLWELSAPPAPLTPRLEGEIACDIAVVGAGFTGLSTALHAAQAVASVVVLDGAEIGF